MATRYDYYCEGCQWGTRRVSLEINRERRERRKRTADLEADSRARLEHLTDVVQRLVLEGP